MDCPLNRTWLRDFLSAGYPVIGYRADSSKFLLETLNSQLCLITLLTRTVSLLQINLSSRAISV